MRERSDLVRCRISAVDELKDADCFALVVLHRHGEERLRAVSGLLVEIARSGEIETLLRIRIGDIHRLAGQGGVSGDHLVVGCSVLSVEVHRIERYRVAGGTAHRDAHRLVSHDRKPELWPFVGRLQHVQGAAVCTRDGFCCEQYLLEQVIDIPFLGQRRAYLVEVLEAAEQIFDGLQEQSPGLRRRPAWSESLLDTDRAHLRHIGNSLKYFFDPVHLQGPHAFLETDRKNIRDTGVFLDQFLDAIGGDQQFMQTDPAFVAVIAAGLAALGFIEGEMTFVAGVASCQIPVDVLVSGLGVSLERSGVEQFGAVFLENVLHLVRGGRVTLLAFGAQTLGQPLRQDPEQRVGKVERVHAHVEQPGDRLRRAVRMQSREHEVARQRGLDAGAGGLLVAHLADHDDVRVGAQERSHHNREIEAGLLVDLDLTQTLLRDFNRILSRPDLGIRRVEKTEDRVERRRFARAGRAAAEEYAVGFAHRCLELRQVRRRQAELLQRDGFPRRENTHDYVLDAALRWNRRHAQLDVERTEFLEFDFPVLRFTLLGNIEVTHDLDARNDGVSVGTRNFDVRNQRPVLPQPDLGLRLAGVGLDVDVRRSLVIRIDDDFVDQLDELVVGRCGHIVVPAHLDTDLVLFEVVKHIADVAGVGGLRPVERLEGFPEVFESRNSIREPAPRKDILDDSGTLHPFGVKAKDDQTFFRFLDRYPLVGFDVVALQVFQQIHRFDAIGLERFVRHPEKLGKRRADRWNLDLELLDQHRFDVDCLLARRPGCELELRGRDYGIAHKKIVFRLEDLRLLALLERNGQRLTEFGYPLLGKLAERHAGSVVDQLDHADEFAAARLRNGRDQHLLGAITGALVDLLQEAQVRVVRLELALVVDVLQVEHPLRQSDVARDRVLGDGQLQVLEGVEAGLHLGDDGLFVLAHGIDRQPVGVEEGANIGADFQHDFVHVARCVDIVGDGLEVLLKRQPAVDVRGRARMRMQYRAHRQSTLRFITRNIPIINYFTTVQPPWLTRRGRFPQIGPETPKAPQGR